ncbi:hypothetical protein HYS28_00195 [Candidatus Uhrbacteria bacterium]|nr:hypothetical protein [Candidatus Uhrbacteria bacterium]
MLFLLIACANREADIATPSPEAAQLTAHFSRGAACREDGVLGTLTFHTNREVSLHSISLDPRFGCGKGCGGAVPVDIAFAGVTVGSGRPVAWGQHGSRLVPRSDVHAIWIHRPDSFDDTLLTATISVDPEDCGKIPDRAVIQVEAWDNVAGRDIVATVR